MTSPKYSNGIEVKMETDCLIEAFRVSTSSIVQPSKVMPSIAMPMEIRTFPGANEGERDGGEGTCELVGIRLDHHQTNVTILLPTGVKDLVWEKV